MLRVRARKSAHVGVVFVLAVMSTTGGITLAPDALTSKESGTPLEGRTTAFAPNYPLLPAFTTPQTLLEEAIPSACLPIPRFENMTALAAYAGINLGWGWGRPDGRNTSALDGASFTFNGWRVSADIDADSSASLTNNQVAGVDEADFVKTDGKFLYAISGGFLVVVEIYPPTSARVLERIPLATQVDGLLMDVEHLVLITTQRGYPTTSPTQRDGWLTTTIVDLDMSWIGWGSQRSTTVLQVYNRTVSPLRLEREIALDGSYQGGRTIGDHLFVTTSFALAAGNGTLVMPTLRVDGVERALAPADIGHLDTSRNGTRLLTLIKLNLSSPDGPSLTSVLAGATSTLYVSQNNLYITGTKWVGSAGFWSQTTAIYKFPLRRANESCVVTGEVPGVASDPFSFDEFGGNLRVATTVRPPSGSGGSVSNSVYVLDGNLSRIGTLEGLAPGETIFSARFMGERLYLVTFRNVDPLFVIDLREPTRPYVLGSLKIPGVSEYLHPVGGGLLLSVGRDTVEDTLGDRALFRGLKLSLFDVRDVSHPVEIANHVIGDRGSTTPVLSDHKAFTWIPSRSLLVLPVRVFDLNETRFAGSPPPDAWGEEVWQGALVFHVSRRGGFMPVAAITHHDAARYADCSRYVYSSTELITRSFVVGALLYAVSAERVTAHVIDDWQTALSLQMWKGNLPAAWCPPPWSPPPPPRRGD